jgi:DNA-directed RNA polymerase specialized sigma subunit
MKRKLPDGFDYDDLVGAGNLGLVLAAANFSPGPIRTTVTAAEAAYARLRIRRAINDSVRGEPYRWETLRSELKQNIAQPEPEDQPLDPVKS